MKIDIHNHCADNPAAVYELLEDMDQSEVACTL